MTRSKRASEHDHSELDLAQFRLRRLAKLIGEGSPIPEADREFLVTALDRIGRGGDANKELSVAGSPGQRKSFETLAARQKKILACQWMTSAMRPEYPQDSPNVLDRGFGYGKKEAAFRAEKAFGIKEGTLLDFWNRHPEFHEASFPALIPDT